MWLNDITCHHVRRDRTLMYILTYCMGGVLLDKLTGFKVVRKVPAFYGTRRFITALIRAPHLSLF
jgi:hypothetical protein